MEGILVGEFKIHDDIYYYTSHCFVACFLRHKSSIGLVGVYHTEGDMTEVN